MIRRQNSRKRFERAVERVLETAAESVAAGVYPDMGIALFEMAANQRAANRAGLDVHDLVKRGSAS